jgi:flagellar hook-basal body complex protein FliE
MVDAIYGIEALVPGNAAAAAPETANAPETNEFIELLAEIDSTVSEAKGALETVAKGESEAPVHELMIALEVSRLQLQMLVEVRNRIVEGYQELTRMQV